MGNLEQAIKSVAFTVAQQWPGVIESGDVQQAIWLRIAESPKSLRVLESLTGKALYDSLKEIGRQVASQERADYDHFSGNYYYSTQDVRWILGRGTLAEGRERTNTERVDLDSGFRALESNNPRYAAIVWSKYVTCDYDESTGDARKLVTRAVDALTREMNRVHEHARGYQFRQRPSNTVTVTRNGVTVTRELTQQEWDLTAKTRAKDLDTYYRGRPLGGPGSRMKGSFEAHIDPELVSDLDEDGNRMVGVNRDE